MSQLAGTAQIFLMQRTEGKRAAMVSSRPTDPPQVCTGFSYHISHSQNTDPGAQKTREESGRLDFMHFLCEKGEAAPPGPGDIHNQAEAQPLSLSPGLCTCSSWSPQSSAPSPELGPTPQA